MPSTPNSATENAHGFVVERVSTLGDIGGELTEYRHRLSAARHLHLETDDGVNAFMVGLLTPPVDDSGLPHVLEHMVLCGGQRTRARRAFFSMLWRSACLAMNADVRDDFSHYHFATHHRKDFHHLLTVYLDCLFQARLEVADFLQEAHRLEPSDSGDDNAPVVHRGVVYSEMLGAMHQPSQQLRALLSRHLFAGSAYAFLSGGDPHALTQLEHTQVIDYYRRMYHPGNALFMSTGDVAAREVQSAIESVALKPWANLQPTPVDPRILEPTPLRSRMVVNESVAAGAGIAQIALAWRLGDRTAVSELLQARVLEALLLATPVSPLRRVLESPKFCGRLSPLCGLDTSRRWLSFCLALEDAAPEQAPALEAALREVLGELSHCGVSAPQREAALDRVERSLRACPSKRHPYGLAHLADLLVPALHGGDASLQLSLPVAFSRLREELSSPGRLEALIEVCLLNNPQCIRLVIQAQDANCAKRSTLVPGTVTDTRPSRNTRELVRVATMAVKTRKHHSENALPTLRISELEPLPPMAPPRVVASHGTNIHVCQCPSHGLVHVQLALRIEPLLPALMQVLPVFIASLSERANGRFNATDVQPAMSDLSNDFSVSLKACCDWQERDVSAVTLLISASSLPRHVRPLVMGMRALIEAAPICDSATLESLVKSARVRLRHDLQTRGHETLTRFTSATRSGTAHIIEQYQGITALVGLGTHCTPNIDNNNGSSLAYRLAMLTEHIRASQRCGHVVADAQYLEDACEDVAAHWANDIRSTGSRFPPWCMPALDGIVHAFEAPVAVGFAARAYSALAPGDADAAALAVLGPLLSGAELHRRIREQGGAYGVGANYCLTTGTFQLWSYRDPQPLATLTSFDDAIGALQTRVARADQIERAKLSVIRALDASCSLAHRAQLRFIDTVLERDVQSIAAFRCAVLDVGRSDVTRVIDSHLTQGNATSAVIANASMLSALDAQSVDTESLR